MKIVVIRRVINCCQIMPKLIFAVFAMIEAVTMTTLVWQALTSPLLLRRASTLYKRRSKCCTKMSGNVLPENGTKIILTRWQIFHLKCNKFSLTALQYSHFSMNSESLRSARVCQISRWLENARQASLVCVGGTVSSGTPDERSVRGGKWSLQIVFSLL